MDSKLPNVGTTIFTVMSQLSADCDAINLSQGFPGFDPDPQLLDLVNHYLESGANQYAPMPGVRELRIEVANKIAAVYGRSVDPDRELTICTGATEGLFSAITAVVRAGDEVIVLDPAYDSYEPAVSLSGGITRHVPLLARGTEFSVDWQRLKEAVNDNTRLIIFNFPHNPTGATLQSGDLTTIAEIVADRDLYLLSDEVYEHIIFDGQAHQSLLRHDDLWHRSFIVSSFGKTCHATGWKVGYCAAPAALSTEFRKVHQFTSFAVVTPIQHALADYLRIKPEHYQELPDFYEKKRDMFASLLEPSGFGLAAAKSTFFQLVDYSALSQSGDVEYAEQLTRNNGVASIPVSVFYEKPPAQQLLRFCFAKDDATLEEAAERLCKL